jgi:hypothetical protein
MTPLIQWTTRERARRIKSGADIIICSILPFLPVEDDDSGTKSSSSVDAGADLFDKDKDNNNED